MTGNTTDDANDAAGTGSSSAELARQPTGTRLLTTDSNYEDPCNYVAEEYVASTFKIEGEEPKILDDPSGCSFTWGKNKVSVRFGSSKPYASIYHAEYAFDKLYQPQAAAQTTGQMGTPGEKPAISGPAPQGTGANGMVEGGTGTGNDNTKGNDSASTVSGITAIAGKFTEPVKSIGNFVAVPGIGDKAVWEPAKHTMHVLMNQHIINVVVDTNEQPQAQQQHAGMLAEVIMNNLLEQN